MFLDRAETFPGPANERNAALGLERLTEAAAETGDDATIRFAAGLAADPRGRAMLCAVFGNSPFLARCLLAEIPFVESLVGQPPGETLEAVFREARMAAAGSAGGTGPSAGDALKRTLRIMRRRTALLVGLADIAGIWTLEEITGGLSRMAGVALDLAVDHLLRAGAATGAFSLAHPETPARDSGFIILGMGKLGGLELNYSSDIDLIVLFDPERIPDPDPERLQTTFVRLTRDLIDLLQSLTADGYVLRTDLRLRPDPGATPLAVSVRAAETYYESIGQNWERAALIKARPVAGDLVAGEAFLEYLRPFIWRRNLDFAAIQDIHSIKRQIAAHRGGNRITVAGHNVKLGRGGIREIEFFAQTQQLIWGGRDPSLRTRSTCEALGALVAAGRLESSVADELVDSYGFLRRVEHRLQMTADRQTHDIPKSPEEIAALATFLGYDQEESFHRDLLGHLHRVEEHYAALFGDSQPLATAGNLVFTGGEHDPDTLATIGDLGFEDPGRVSTIIRGWHHGRYRATHTVRARELLTELVPRLLEAFAGTANPDAALLGFDEFLAGLPAGVQLFSLFQARPNLLDLVAEIMGGAPWLAGRLRRYPALFDGLLDADFMSAFPDAADLATGLDRALDQARNFEDVLDIARRWTAERRFQAGIRILLDVADAEDSGRAFADIAGTVIPAMQARVEAEFSARHGSVPGSGMAVVAYGKLGGRELTPGADLDLVIVFDCPEKAESSDGPKPLTPGHYFNRLGQSFINALTAPTAEGLLYEVDLRLRPSGNSGSLVPHFDGYRQYLENEAWTWELMALVRARVVSGPPALRERLEAMIHDVIRRPRDPEALLADVAAMRARMARHNRTDSVWQVKHVRGGLVDIEFLTQYLVLRHAAAHPDIPHPRTAVALARLGEAGLLSAADCDMLTAAVRFWHRLQAMLRLTVGSGREADPETMPAGLQRLLARAGEAKDMDDLIGRMESTAARVRALFDRMIVDAAPATATTEKEPQG